ncbi:MAG: NYN domain-containing protein [Blastocatellia bacterium]|nr:NYN domain-containing protein [Blastocatellia bacterium]
MGYIVDGNNIMGRNLSRTKLLDLLADFVDVKKCLLTVVFDGAPDPVYKEGSLYHGVKLLYSRPSSTADARIREMIVKTKHPRELIVVSSDRELIATVRAYGAKHIHSKEFLSRMRAEISASILKQAEKKAPKAEMSEWLRYFGCEPDEADLDEF